MKGLRGGYAATIGLLLLASAGCMEDTKGTYKAVADKNGDMVPGDASQRGFVKAPDPDSTELVPVAKPSDPRSKTAKGKALPIRKSCSEFPCIPTRNAPTASTATSLCSLMQ